MCGWCEGQGGGGVVCVVVGVITKSLLITRKRKRNREICKASTLKSSWPKAKKKNATHTDTSTHRDRHTYTVKIGQELCAGQVMRALAALLTPLTEILFSVFGVFGFATRTKVAQTQSATRKKKQTQGGGLGGGGQEPAEKQHKQVSTIKPYDQRNEPS